MYCYDNDIRKVERYKKYFIKNMRDENIDPSVCEAMSHAMNRVILTLSSSAYERELDTKSSIGGICVNCGGCTSAENHPGACSCKYKHGASNDM